MTEHEDEVMGQRPIRDSLMEPRSISTDEDQAEHEDLRPKPGKRSKDSREFKVESRDHYAANAEGPLNILGGGPSDRRSRAATLPSGPAPDGDGGLPVHKRLSPNLPGGLAEDGPGAELWRSIAAEPLLLSTTERHMLIMACRSLDLAEQLAAVVAAEGPMLPWGEDSTRAHPLISKIAEHRGLAARLLRTLEVPKENETTESGGVGSRQRGVYRLYHQRWADS